jgi:hypothetical protein
MPRLLSPIVILLALVGLASPVNAQCGSGGSCLEIRTTGGCSNTTCCGTVCLVDPGCCSIAWDAGCVLLADQLCAGLCGASASGSCFAPNPSPACSIAPCCETVCAADPFCCATQWDFSCASLAGFLCSAGQPGTCGDPAAGSCSQPHATGACSDLACCTAVCGLDPSCCEFAWDQLCVALAATVCVDACPFSCPPDGQQETEACDERTNDPCTTPPGSAGAIACGETRCGQVFFDETLGIDRDGWLFEVQAPPGAARRVSIVFGAQAAAYLVVLPHGCGDLADAVATIPQSFCSTSTTNLCLVAGSYLMLVVPGTPETPAGATVPCGFSAYRLSVDCLDLCEDPCGASEAPCDTAHGEPGCSDAKCCGAVCTADPLCCTKSWDALCVAAAQKLCGFEPPPNDFCSGAIEAPTGATPLNNELATAAPPAFPKSCAGDLYSGDLWFRHTVECGGVLRIETCGETSFDTVIAVYRGDCTDPILLGCNDDAELCTPAGASRLSIEAECGETLLIRVAGFGTATGAGTLAIACLGPLCSDCPADLDGDGLVAGADLGILLGAWGGPGPLGDLDGSGTVGGADLAILLGSWGPCP